MTTQLPMTIQQEWLWEAICANQSWQCAATRGFRLSGSLNIELLQQCLRDIGGRHDALRTYIVSFGGGARQEIRDRAECVLDCITIAGTSDASTSVCARRQFEEICDRKMDLSAGPFWKATLLRLNEEEYWLVLAMHRVIGDCVGIEQIYRELKFLYGECLQGRPSSLRPPAQYGNYTAWQQRTSNEWNKRHEPHWKRHLEGAAPVQWPVEMDFGIAAPGVLGKAECSFGKSCSAALLDLARTLRTLPAVPMMAIYAAVLWRWCQQKDFVLPLNTAGRPSEYKSAIGYFSYPLYLRINITGDETFRDFVSRVGNEFFNSLSHQDFGRIVRQRPELLSGTLFQWVTWYPEEVPDELVRLREFGEGMTVVSPGITALEVTVFDTATGIHAFGSYRADRFRTKTMERFMQDLRSAADLFVHNPDVRIATIAEAGENVHKTSERGVSAVAAIS